MPSTAPVQSPGSTNYVDYDEFVDFQLEKTRASLRATEVVTTLTILAAVFAGYLLIFVVIDQWVVAGGINPWVRSILLLALLTGMGAVAFRHILLPLLRRIHPLYAARAIERADPKFQSNLINFVDLRSGGATGTSAPVVRAIEKRAAIVLDRMDIDEAVDRRPLLRTAYALLGIVVLSAAYIVFSPKDPFASVQRALLPLAQIGVATETTISDVTPGTIRVPARSVVTVEADIRGRPVDQVQLQFTTSDRKYVDHPLEMRRIDAGLPRFRGILNGENGRGLLENLQYRIVAGDARTESFQIDVTQPPAAQIDQIGYHYPAYMQLEDRTSEGGTIDGWEGSRVTLRATANMPVAQARIVLTDTDAAAARGEDIPLKVTDGIHLEASWNLQFRTDGTYARFYHVEVKTPSGDTDPEPTHFSVQIRPDQRPDVALTHPAGDLQKPANAIVPLHVVASDPDFLLRSVTLKCERNGEEFADQRLFEKDLPSRAVSGTYEFDLGKLGLKSGDRLQYWIEARDNKQPTSNRTNTPRMNIEIESPFPSEQEAQRDLAREQQKLDDQLAQAEQNRNPERGGAGESEPQPAPQESTDVADREPRRPEQTGGTAQPGRDAPDQNDAETSDATARDDEQAGREPDDEQAEFQRKLERLIQREEETRQREQTNEDRQDPSREEPAPSAGDEQQQQQQQRDQNSSNSKGGQKNGGQKQGAGRQEGQNAREHNDQQAGTNEGESQDSAESDSDAAEKPTQSNASRPRDQRAGSRQNSREPKSSDASEIETSESEKDADSDDGNPSSETAKPNRPDKSTRRDGGTNAEEDGTTGAGENSEPEGQKPEGQETTTGEQSREDNPGTKANGQPSRTQPEQPRESPDNPVKSQPDKQRKPGDQSPKTGAGEKPQESARPDEGSAEQSAQQKTGRKPKPEPGKEGIEDPSGGDVSSDKPADDQGSPPPGKSKTGSSDSQSDQSGGAQKSQGDRQNRDPGDDASESQDDENPGESSRPTGRDAKDKRSSAGRPKPPEGAAGEESGTPENPEDQPDPGSEGATEDQTSGDEPPAAGGQKQQPKGRQTDQKNARSGNKPEKSSDEAGAPQPRGKDVGDNLEHDDPSSEESESDPQEAGEGSKPPKQAQRRPNNASEVGNQAPKGEGRKQGQKSEQPQAGEKGESGASDKGETGGNQEGEGSESGEAGEAETAQGKTGKSSENQAGKGSQSKPGGRGESSTQGSGSAEGPGESGAQEESDASSGDAGNPSQQSGGKSGESSQGGEGSKGQSGQKGGPGGKSSTQQSQGKSGTGRPNSPTGGGSMTAPKAGSGDDAGKPGNAEGAATPDREPASGESQPNDEQEKLEHLREASNLVLQKLKGTLERGDVDDELMKELGWKDMAELQKFVSRLEEQIDQTGDDNSPEALARRKQFEELLRSMTMGTQTQSRERGQTGERRVNQIDIRRGPVPAELRERFEAYTRGLTRQKEREAGNSGSKPAEKARGAKPSR